MTKPMNIATATAGPVLRGEPKRYVFLLLRSFSALDLCAALDALKEANSFDGTARYTWTTLSEDGSPVEASNGLGFTVDATLSNLDRRDTIIVLGGDDFVSTGTLPVQAWLRRQARKGVTVGGIRSAAFVLARAGLLDGHETAAHWSCQAALKEVHPDLEVTRGVYQMGEARFTGAGGASTLDIMIHLISREQGTDVATWVADRLVYSAPRCGRQEQTIGNSCRLASRNDKVAEAIGIMTREIELQTRPEAIARRVGVSSRQLERLFARHLGTSPKSYLTKLRLEKARALLLQTNMKLIEVAIASGFNNPDHFSRSYRRHFGLSPCVERGIGGLE